MGVFAPVRRRPRRMFRVTFVDARNLVDTDAAAAEHFVGGLASMQTETDLRYVRQARLVGVRRATAGAAGYTVELQAALTYQGTAGNFSPLGTSAISVNASAASAIVDTGWVNISPTYRVEQVIVCPIASGGDGVVDPNWGVIAAEFR